MERKERVGETGRDFQVRRGEHQPGRHTWQEPETGVGFQTDTCLGTATCWLLIGCLGWGGWGAAGVLNLPDARKVLLTP